MYSPWMKVCGKGQDTSNKQVCVITKDGRLENGMPVAIVAAVRAGRRAEGAARHGAARHAIAARHPRDHRSGPAGQRALHDLLPGRLHVGLPGHRRHDRQDEEGQDAHVQAINMQGTPISLPLPLADFAKAYDGPPTDPKVFEEQQRKLQEELQKKAEEARKKLEGQQHLPARRRPRLRQEIVWPTSDEKGAASAAPFFFRCAASVQLTVARRGSRRCRPARTLPRPADGGSACRRCRAASSARRHRRRIRSPRFRRTDDRTAGPCADARRRGSTCHHSSVLLNTGSMSNTTPRNGNRRCLTTWPIWNLACVVFCRSIMGLG